MEVGDLYLLVKPLMDLGKLECQCGIASSGVALSELISAFPLGIGDTSPATAGRDVTAGA